MKPGEVVYTRGSFRKESTAPGITGYSEYKATKGEKLAFVFLGHVPEDFTLTPEEACALMEVQQVEPGSRASESNRRALADLVARIERARGDQDEADPVVAEVDDPDGE